MKPILLILSFGLAVFLGFVPSIFKVKPIYWQIGAIATVVISIILNLIFPLAASTDELNFLSKAFSDKIEVEIKTIPNNHKFDQELGVWVITVQSSKKIPPIILKSKVLPNEFNTSKSIIVSAIFDKELKHYEILKISAINPIATFPFVIGLEQRIRIMNFHVPMAWISVLAYLVAMIYSIRYLKTKDFRNDAYATAAASLGLLFTIITTTTGMVWAKYNWGSFWNWDPREVSIFILMLIYAAYFVFRASMDNQETKARLSAVYSILAFTTVPFLVFILPRIQAGLHPGSGSDSNTGPVLSNEKGLLDSTMLYAFCWSLMSFTMLFFWILNMQFRAIKLKFEKKLT